jgi:hypothetical protein
MKTRTIKSGHHFEINITTDRSGRTSIVVHDNKFPYQETPLVDVELPAKEGQFKDSFKPIVKVAKEVEVKQA